MWRTGADEGAGGRAVIVSRGPRHKRFMNDVHQLQSALAGLFPAGVEEVRYAHIACVIWQALGNARRCMDSRCRRMVMLPPEAVVVSLQSMSSRLVVFQEFATPSGLDFGGLTIPKHPSDTPRTGGNCYWRRYHCCRETIRSTPAVVTADAASVAVNIAREMVQPPVQHRSRIIIKLTKFAPPRSAFRSHVRLAPQLPPSNRLIVQP